MQCGLQCDVFVVGLYPVYTVSLVGQPTAVDIATASYIAVDYILG